ncbi:MAG: STAS domain-containing protein [Saprospiraceae bacterium]|nr:STAS domain-containing protein [Saprospiraceae bacterium]
MKSEFIPKFFSLVRQGIPLSQVTKDALAGITVGIVALPLAIAFAIASGVSPEKGLITAIVAGFIISLLGGSRVQIGGPTGAFIIIVFGIVEKYGVSGLTIATFMAGFLIIGMGLLKLGNWLKYIPYPLVVGFTAGIAVIIFSSQIGDFFGLGIKSVPSNFFEKWITYSAHFNGINWTATILAASTVLITVFFNRITNRVPGSIVAILLTTFLASYLHLPVETIASRFGEIPSHIAWPKIPSVDFETIRQLVEPALAIALLGGIESLLSAVVADGMIGTRHRSNMELVAQGVANIFSALFGGIPATGAIARTATNIKNGGRTPIAGMVHAFVLLLIMLIFAPLAKLIPLATLSGILVVVAYNMSEWKNFISILKGNKTDIIILLTTFFFTVVFDLIIAIEIGIVLSSLLFMKRMSDSLQIDAISKEIPELDAEEKVFDENYPGLPKEITIYEINGPLFFGASRHFQDALSHINYHPRIVIIRMRYVPFIDATGYRSLIQTIRSFQSTGTIVMLSGVSHEVRDELERNKIDEILERDKIFEDFRSALDVATHSLKSKK